MLTPYDMHGYQVRAVKHSLEHDQSTLWLDMGLGKTVITTSVIYERMQRAQVYGTLIIAPLRVCQTVWAQEARKWEHTKDITFSLIHGPQRKRIAAAMKRADVYLINYENLVWFVDFIVDRYLSRGRYPPFNMAVFDEVTKLKDAGTKRHKALRKLLAYIPYRMGLTGTPASNGYLDLFGQYLAIDSGVRLGQYITHYKDAYFDAGWQGFSYDLKPGAKEIIQSRIADITLQMSAEDYLSLPAVTFNDIAVTMPDKARAKYTELERDLFTELDSGVEIEVANQAALSNKCLQAANGAMYDDVGVWQELHQAKLDALEDVIEESAGQPVLVLHNFRHDRERILKRFPKAVSMDGNSDPVQIVNDWDDGKIQILLAHPASAGHGLNLQYGGHIAVWFGLNWSLDLYLQANARLDRQGQKTPVILHRLLTEDTLDYAVLEALDNKASTQSDLRAAITNYRNRA